MIILGATRITTLAISLNNPTFTGKLTTDSLVVLTNEDINDTKFGITASTTQTQGQQPLTGKFNEISTVANPDDVITLPLGQLGITVCVTNDGANKLQVFPDVGANLGNGINNSTVIFPKQSIQFFCIDGAKWIRLSQTSSDISCKVTKSADQTITNSTSTIITWDQEDYDTDGMHDNVTNNSRITIKTPGKYSIMAQFEWASNSTGKRIIDIMKNSVVLGKANYLASGSSQHTISFVGSFVVDDILEVRVFQDSGGNLDFLNNITYFEVVKID